MKTPKQEAFRLSTNDFSFTSTGFKRPECVSCGASGAVYASDARGGVLRLSPEGAQTLIGETSDAPTRFKPNGYILMRDGSIVFANLGTAGGLWRITPDGEHEPFLGEVDGVVLPTVNFVWMDDQERIWFCVSSMRPRESAFDTTANDGFIGLIDDKGARIVSDGMVWTNECRIAPDGRSFYVNETFGRRTTRFDLAKDGSLSNRTTYAEYGTGTFPDGMAFDVEGGLWVVSVVTNRIFRLLPDGSQHLLFEDFEQDHVDKVEAKLVAGDLYSATVYERHSSTLLNTSSIAFGGSDLRTVYLGCIAGDRIAMFKSPVSGLRPVHWDWS
ncbi:SMP-30/gluconolactonase/LRE family protein [Hwanghaeella sp. LZ110]|uniref:SMP-30/gluconolactonase/LRE family protein n=1 Tax=Hwanghaeella sp. LZ110 TaxID=3402810 RepID=UPI003B67FC0F